MHISKRGKNCEIRHLFIKILLLENYPARSFFNLVGIWIQKTYLQGFENLAGKQLENHLKKKFCISIAWLMKNQTF